MMIPTCAIPLPLGYDAWSMTKRYAPLIGQQEVDVLWTSPNGRPISVRAVADDETLRTDEFWQMMLERVQDYVHGTHTNNVTGEKNERPVSTIDDVPYSRGPTTIRPAEPSTGVDSGTSE